MTLVALAAAQWQGRRAAEKTLQAQAIKAAAQAPVLDLESTTAAPLQPYRRARVSGRFDTGRAVFLDNRTINGAVGRLVLMPLRTASGKEFLVDRGWIAQAPGAPLPTIVAPAGSDIVEGVLVPELPAFARFADRLPLPLPAIWSNFDWATWRTATRWTGPQWILVQTNDSRDGLTRHWEPPAAQIDKHLGYRLQWFAIAALAFGLSCYFGTQPWRKQN